MPLLRKQPFRKLKPPADLREDEEIFYCKITNEIFRDYEAFFERIILCNSLVWSCAITGRSGMTYQEAEECEEKAKRHLATFQDSLQRPLLFMATLTHRGRLVDLNDDVFLFAKDRYFIGETVDVLIGGERKASKIMKVVPPTDSSSKSNGDVIVIDEDSESEGDEKRELPQADQMMYIVCPLSGKNNRVMIKATQVSRKKGLYTRDKSKLFLKQHCEPVSGVWTVKESVMRKMHLTEARYDDFFSGPRPRFAMSVIKKKNGKKGGDRTPTKGGDKTLTKGGDNTPVTPVSSISNTPNNETSVGSTGDSPTEAVPSPQSSLTAAEKAARKEQERLDKIAERIAKQQEMKQKIEEEKQRRKEEREKERMKKREEKKKQLEKLKEWSRPREDMECDDLKPLPEFKKLNTRVPTHLIGDAVMVLEYVNAFKVIFDFKQFFPKGFSWGHLESALMEPDPQGSLCDLIQMLLCALFNLQEEEAEEYQELEKEEEGVEMKPAISHIGEDEQNEEDDCISNNELIRSATVFAQFPQLAFGMPLRDTLLDQFTLTEVVRLHLMSSGARANSRNARFRYQQRGGYSSLDDPGLELRKQDPLLLKKLQTGNVFDFTPDEKLKVVKTLVQQVMTYAAVRDIVEDSYDKLRVKKYDLKLLQWAEMRRVREDQAASYKRQMEEKLKERDYRLKELARAEKIRQAEERGLPQAIPPVENPLETPEQKRRREEKEHQEEIKKKSDYSKKELEALQQIMELQRINALYPLGRDRQYRRYWLFSSFPAVLVEDHELFLAPLVPSNPTLHSEDKTDMPTLTRQDHNTSSDKENEMNSTVLSDPTKVNSGKTDDCIVISDNEEIEAKNMDKVIAKGLDTDGVVSKGLNTDGVVSKGLNTDGVVSLKKETKGLDTDGVVSVKKDTKGLDTDGIVSVKKETKGLDTDGIVSVKKETQTVCVEVDTISIDALSKVDSGIASADTTEADDNQSNVDTEPPRLNSLPLEHVDTEPPRLDSLSLEHVDTEPPRLDSLSLEHVDTEPPRLDSLSLEHVDQQQQPKWFLIDSKVCLQDLLNSLNPRGFRESGLQAALQEYKPLLDMTIESCPLDSLCPPAVDEADHASRTQINTRQSASRKAEDCITHEPASEAIELTLRDGLLDLEDRIFVGSLGAIKVKVRAAWRAALENGSYDPQTHEAPFVNAHRCRQERNQSEEETAVITEEIIAKDLSLALVQIARGVELRFLTHPLGDDGEDSKKKSSKEEKHDTSDKEPRRRTIYERWEESVLGASSLSQIFLHLAALDRSIKWDRSALLARCKICRRKGDADKMLLCDKCDHGHHMYCLKPPMTKVPLGDWFCPNCRPKLPGPSPRKNRRRTFSEVEEDEEEEEELELQDTIEETSEVDEGEQQSEEELVEEEEEMEEEEEEEDEDSEEEEENEDMCAECQQDGKLILCDVCPRSYHLHCARPPLKKVPKGKWMCQVCVGGGRAGKIQFGRIKTFARPRECFAKKAETPKGPTASGKKSSSRPGSKRETPRNSPTLSSGRPSKRDSTGQRSREVTPKMRGQSDKDSTSKLWDNVNAKLKRSSSSSSRLSADADFETSARHYTSSKRGNTQVQQMRAVEELLQELIRHPDAWPFLKPVDKKLVPDYYDVIENPMDLSTIRNKVHRYQYTIPSQLLDDVRLIFANCIEYNARTTPEYRAGQALTKFFQTRIRELGLHDDVGHSPPLKKQRR